MYVSYTEDKNYYRIKKTSFTKLDEIDQLVEIRYMNIRYSFINFVVF